MTDPYIPVNAGTKDNLLKMESKSNEAEPKPEVIDDGLFDKMQQMIDISGDVDNYIAEKELRDKISDVISGNVNKSVMLTEEELGCHSDNESDNLNLCLTDLPAEVLIHIASFLGSRSVIKSLYPVCKLFHTLFCDDRYWKTRISHRWKKTCPVIERDDIKWHRVCMEREEFHDLWMNPNEAFHHFITKEGFYAAVDVVHLMKGGQYLAVGSRDRHLNIFDLDKYDCDSEHPTGNLNVFSDSKTHKGWVWSMASHDNTLVTGSWDSYIRLWDFGDGEVRPNTHIKLNSAILGLYYEPNFVAAGGFDKRLYLMDPRAPNEVTRKRYHSKPILCVTGDSKYVITGGEDTLISIYDRVAGKNYKKIETESFVNSVSYGDGQLWTGDKEGRIHVFDARNGLFDETTMQTFDIGHTGRLTGLVHTGGGLLTCSSDSVMKVVEPTKDPDVIQTLKVHSGEVARIAHNNGVVATAGADVSVGVWLPRKHTNTCF